MTIPFLQFFKRGKIGPSKGQAAAPLPVLSKPSSERMSKTVMPNVTRTIGPQDPFRLAAGAGGMTNMPAGVPGSTANAPRVVAFGGNRTTNPALPRAVALALEPRVERVISLELGDILPQLPSDLIKAIEPEETKRRVLLKASEIEKGMANGRPSVLVASIYQQIPEIFLRAVLASDMTQVQLPFAKVLEQFTQLQVRSDQRRDHAVPQVKTPFLQVTIEDSDKFGVPFPTQSIETSPLPPVRVEPATAHTIAAAEPEPAGGEKVVVPARNGEGDETLPFPARNGTVSIPPPMVPRRIPFKLEPNGTDAPASEKVPASRGASVPTSPAAPVRIDFKAGQPFGAKADATAESAKAETADPAEASPTEGVQISLPLRPILQTLPPMQLRGDANSVPADARVELSFALVQPQLATGRVTIAPAVFAAALPEAHREIFDAEAVAADVSLPLQDVLKNLPDASLEMRGDQVEQEAGEQFATPFSAKAEEDAKRFGVKTAPSAKRKSKGAQSAPAEPESLPESVSPAVPEPSPAEQPIAETRRSPLQEALETDEELDAKGVVARVDKLAGVKASALLFGDGLSLAGNLPAEWKAEGLCAMAPSLLLRIENHMVDTTLGKLRAMTLACANSTITFFMHDNLCLAALHSNGELAPGVRDRLSTVVQEISRKYSQPA
ncbi:MAG TPA: hypothetical protein VGQ82_01420 [Chthoniobacterales bacterium]|nr:hypothetical protein [Chthoniobacterales bacterium]